eukprot:2237486-Rhodomonas_salina.1
MSQRRTLPQHLRQSPRSLIANIIAAQVKISQRLALPQHLHALEPRALSSFGPTCFQRDHEMLRQAPQVLPNATLAQRRVVSWYKNDAAAVADQIPPKLFAHPHSRDHPLSRPKNSQQSWRQ